MYQIARCELKNFVEASVQAHSLGKMNNECPYCKALLFECEIRTGVMTTCCRDGQIDINIPGEAYPPLLNLDSGTASRGLWTKAKS